MKIICNLYSFSR